MRSFKAGKIFLSALLLLSSISSANAIPQPKTRAILTPFICQQAGASDVSAKFVNSGGSLLLNLRTSQTNDGAYCGGVLDRIDGYLFNTLDMDISGGCQSGFEVVFFGSDPITGDFAAADATCADAVVTTGKGGFSHLHFTPGSFGFGSSPTLIQIYIIQGATSSSTHNVLIKNVVVNNGSTTPISRLGGCQL
jgi:hypothetical protein